MAELSTEEKTVAKTVEVANLFDDLTEESFYGFNFRHILLRSNDKLLHDLREFIDLCKAERIAIEIIKEETDSQYEARMVSEGDAIAERYYEEHGG